MNSEERSAHWETIYKTKLPEETSWYQVKPEQSIALLNQLDLPKDASIIDVGGGQSLLVDHLLHDGFDELSVLDISNTAIEKTKTRIGQQSKKVQWIVADVASLNLYQTYHLWHDRATFHFLIDEDEIKQYVQSTEKYIQKNGYLILATFAENGPKKCSGLPIKQYSSKSLEDCFSTCFDLINSFEVAHQTPFNTTQLFTFGLFQKVRDPLSN